MEPTLIVNEKQVLPDGRVYFRRRYSDGFAIEGVYHPDGDEVPRGRRYTEMATKSAAVNERMCCEATSEADRAYLNSRWDEAWS